MTEREIRELIADALNYAAVPGFRGTPSAAEFVAGTTDISFEDIEIDSLAAMEVCIAIETSLGVSILPAELPKAGSLAGLVKLVSENGAA